MVDGAEVVNEPAQAARSFSQESSFPLRAASVGVVLPNLSIAARLRRPYVVPSGFIGSNAETILVFIEEVTVASVLAHRLFPSLVPAEIGPASDERAGVFHFLYGADLDAATFFLARLLPHFH